MDFLPVFLNIKSQSCLVVGGGDVATRKSRTLLQAGAKVHVLAPECNESMQKMVEQGKVVYHPEKFTSAKLDGYKLVIAATDDMEVNELVSTEAKKRNMPVNVVDAPDLCSFILPSIIDRSPVMVAVSSGGSSPVLARLLRTRMETLIPASYGRLAALVGSFRDAVKQRFDNTNDRRKFWEKVLEGPVTEMMFAGQDEAARGALEQAINNGADMVEKRGEVYLVGAGPGDPDLLTFRALRLLQQADVIVYDRLVSQPVLDLARRDADMIYVGKKKSDHTLPQEEINQLLVRLAKEGKRVLRLKGGDPFVFGRGGEEIDTLMDEGVLFQVVPGITAASGCAAYAGIPLTHRDHAQSVVFATGHLQDNSIDLNWKALAQPNQTVVFYMGLTGLSIICEQLVENGMSANTPIALIQRGTTPEQVVMHGTLETMPDMFNSSHIKPPTLIIVGDVVRLHEKLSWFKPEKI